MVLCIIRINTYSIWTFKIFCVFIKNFKVLENIKYKNITFALPIANKILKKYKKIYTFISFDVIIKQMF